MDRIFACILSQLERIEDKVDHLHQTLDEHGKMLDEQVKILDDQGKILNEHGKILDEHGKILSKLERSKENYDRTDINGCKKNGPVLKNMSIAVSSERELFENNTSERHSLNGSNKTKENGGTSIITSPETSLPTKPQSSVHQHVNLEDTENAQKFSESAEVIGETQELYNELGYLLDELTVKNLKYTASQIQKLPINSSVRLFGFVDLLCRQAFTSPSFPKKCAKLSKMLSSSASFKMNDKENYNKNQTDFRKILLNSCQMWFDTQLRKINIESNKSFLCEREQTIRLAGVCRFLGELFKLDMVKTSVMHDYITGLLKEVEEERLESLCELLTTIGKHYESKVENNNQALDPIMDELSRLVTKKGRNIKHGHQISPRVKSSIQAVLKLRQNDWRQPLHTSNVFFEDEEADELGGKNWYSFDNIYEYHN